MWVLLTVGPKCTLTALHRMLPLVSCGEYANGTDRRTDARPLRYAFRYMQHDLVEAFLPRQ